MLAESNEISNFLYFFSTLNYDIDGAEALPKESAYNSGGDKKITSHPAITSDGKKVEVGAPAVKGVSVSAKIVEHLQLGVLRNALSECHGKTRRPKRVYEHELWGQGQVLVLKPSQLCS